MGRRLPLPRLLLIDIAIIDHTAPGAEGFEIAREIITECPGVKALVLLAHTNNQFTGIQLEAETTRYAPINGALNELDKVIRNLLIESRSEDIQILPKSTLKGSIHSLRPNTPL